MENIIVEGTDLATRITINRPKVLNALNAATIFELTRALSELPKDTRVVVLTGSGDKAFIAGADIAEMANLSATEAAGFSKAGHDLGDLIASLDAIVIAEVNGLALGGGCELMLACDFAIASDKAKIGQPEVGLGVTPGFGGTTRLLRRVGIARAKQLLVTGQHIEASQALAWGLVNEVVPQIDLRARVDALAQMITDKAPIAVALCKKAADLSADAPLCVGNTYEQKIFGICFSTNDQKEGMRAFLEKRKPAWTRT